MFSSLTPPADLCHHGAALGFISRFVMVSERGLRTQSSFTFTRVILDTEIFALNVVLITTSILGFP